MYVKRDLEQEIGEFLDRKEVLTLKGARQTGKTTLLRRLENTLKSQGKSVKYITFEKKGDLALFLDDIEDFRDLCIQYDAVILDEFQYAKEGGRNIKYLYDSTDVKFIISGSSSLELTFYTGKYMVGRMFSFILRPFSFREYLSAADSELHSLIEKRIPEFTLFEIPDFEPFGAEINNRLGRAFEQYLVWGGYPETVLAEGEKVKKKIIGSILANYLLKDIADLLKLATEESLLKLAKALASQIGSLIEYKELGTLSGLPHKELKEHLRILEETYIIKQVRPFFSNKRTELVKNPKVYFPDTGLRNLLVQDFRKPFLRNDTGFLAENAVCACLDQLCEELEEVRFWRTKSQAEVDFVMQKGEEKIPLEVKYRNSPPVGKSMYSFINKYSPSRAYIITKDTFRLQQEKNCRIIFLPIYYL